MLKILQARFQQYVNRELPDVQAGFRKGRGRGREQQQRPEEVYAGDTYPAAPRCDEHPSHPPGPAAEPESEDPVRIQRAKKTKTQGASVKKKNFLCMQTGKSDVTQ